MAMLNMQRIRFSMKCQPAADYRVEVCISTIVLRANRIVRTLYVIVGWLQVAVRAVRSVARSRPGSPVRPAVHVAFGSRANRCEAPII